MCSPIQRNTSEADSYIVTEFEEDVHSLTVKNWRCVKDDKIAASGLLVTFWNPPEISMDREMMIGRLFVTEVYDRDVAWKAPDGYTVTEQSSPRDICEWVAEQSEESMACWFDGQLR